jgi:hypothetical protein
VENPFAEAQFSTNCSPDGRSVENPIREARIFHQWLVPDVIGPAAPSTSWPARPRRARRGRPVLRARSVAAALGRRARSVAAALGRWPAGAVDRG